MKGFTGVADKQGGWGDCACVTGRGTGFQIGRGAGWGLRGLCLYERFHRRCR